MMRGAELDLLIKKIAIVSHDTEIHEISTPFGTFVKVTPTLQQVLTSKGWKNTKKILGITAIPKHLIQFEAKF
jgi:hypothetical protein